MTVEVTFRDKHKRELGKIHSSGHIGSGLFGGSISEAIETAAKEVAQYASKNLEQKR